MIHLFHLLKKLFNGCAYKHVYYGYLLLETKGESMDSEIDIVQKRLNSFLGQLQVEFGILDRIVYKNKNQHRRSSYFQYLLKVRRDLRLLQSAHLEEIFSSSFLVISGTRPKQKVQLLESLKRRKCDGGKHNFLERLLGAARLLSQIVEPMLKAATEISTLLAQSFFMGFCLTTLALLARLRVLVQQILLDAVTVFNMVFSLSQKEQSVKLTQDGIEVFREYYPMNEQSVLLDCVWETDKFVLLEISTNCKTERQEKNVREISIGPSAIQYQSIEVLLGDNESGKADPNDISEDYSHIEVDNPSSIEDPSTENDDVKKVQDSSKVEDVSGFVEPLIQNLNSESGLLMDLSSSPGSNPLKRKSGSTSKVAFVSVKKPATSTTNVLGLQIKGTESHGDSKEDPFFSLLTGGNLKDSLF
ncbi:uncharacterized protein LOC131321823 isoform X1 [Rhododendron vialii]|uniref:uncharacterized protein LOC131321823 isoform X1 n=1 Tax=Rhododendron vialii TaxID=182163 RepID=UPI002660401C|nr:uncharacterized protein LOC131321823 isoform X1 [Rhododendron vialii]